MLRDEKAERKKGNAYPIPLIKDLLQEASMGKIFMKLDLRDPTIGSAYKKGMSGKAALTRFSGSSPIT